MSLGVPVWWTTIFETTRLYETLRLRIRSSAPHSARVTMLGAGQCSRWAAASSTSPRSVTPGHLLEARELGRECGDCAGTGAELERSSSGHESLLVVHGLPHRDPSRILGSPRPPRQAIT